jgi:hypothetical protein
MTGARTSWRCSFWPRPCGQICRRSNETPDRSPVWSRTRCTVSCWLLWAGRQRRRRRSSRWVSCLPCCTPVRAFAHHRAPTATAQAATLAGRHGLRLLKLLILKDLHDKVLVRRRPADQRMQGMQGVQRMQGVMKEGVNGGTKELLDTILGAELAAKLC